MDIRKKLVIGTVALLALGGLGSTAALAKSKAPAKAPGVAAEPIPTTDPDNIQEGDQSTPDLPGMTAVTTSAKSTTVTSSKASGSDEGQGEGQGESDGPGGHEDPPGNVDYQFDGEQ